MRFVSIHSTLNNLSSDIEHDGFIHTCHVFLPVWPLGSSSACFLPKACNCTPLNHYSYAPNDNPHNIYIYIYIFTAIRLLLFLLTGLGSFTYGIRSRQGPDHELSSCWPSPWQRRLGSHWDKPRHRLSLHWNSHKAHTWLRSSCWRESQLQILHCRTSPEGQNPSGWSVVHFLRRLWFFHPPELQGYGLPPHSTKQWEEREAARYKPAGIVQFQFFCSPFTFV